MNDIHPTAVVGRGVRLGKDNTIGPYVVIGGGAQIGNGNWIGAHSVIGAPPEVRSAPHGEGWLDAESTSVRIGDGNVLREAVQVHSGWRGVTTLGDGLFVMNQAYVAHDVVLADGVTLASSVTIAGNVTVGRNANLGLNSAVHQGRRVGAFVMLGMGGVVTRDLPPFAVCYGSPARARRANAVGLERAGLPLDAIEWAGRWIAADSPDDAATLQDMPDALRADLDAWIADR